MTGFTRMQPSDFIRNQLIRANYELAEKKGIEQKPFYEVQRNGASFEVLKNGEVIAAFNHPIRANEFKVKCER